MHGEPREVLWVWDGKCGVEFITPSETRVQKESRLSTGNSQICFPRVKYYYNLPKW